jgi:hypothetical protein
VIMYMTQTEGFRASAPIFDWATMRSNRPDFQDVSPPALSPSHVRYSCNEMATLNPYIADVCFGAIALSVFSERSDGAGSRFFIQSMLPSLTELQCRWVAFFVDVIFGTFIGLLIYTPKTDLEGFFAGIGWVGAFQTAIRSVPTKKRGRTDVVPPKKKGK